MLTHQRPTSFLRRWLGCAGAATTLFSAAILQWYAFTVSVSLPTPFAGVQPNGGTVCVELSTDWIALIDRRAWAEVSLIEFGGPRAVITGPDGHPSGLSAPSMFGAGAALASLRDAGPGSASVVRASGWPLRTWLSVSVRSARDSSWTAQRNIQWGGCIVDASLAAAVGFAGGWCSAALIFSACGRRRNSRGACPACGYDLRGASACQCPECGAAAPVKLRR